MKRHWLECLSATFGPYAEIRLDIDTARRVFMRIAVVRQGKLYKLERTVSWSEIESARLDPLDSMAHAIIDEWRSVSGDRP